MKALTLTSVLALASLAGTANAQFYRLGVDQGLSNSISNTGAVVGDNNNTGQYFLWTSSAGGMDIGGAVAGQGVGGQPTISNDGLYVGGTNYSNTNNWYEIARYDVTAGSWTGFGALPGIGVQVDLSVGSGWAISGNGQSVGGLSWTNQGTADTHASYYTAGSGWTDLGTNQVGESARINGLNNDASVAVGWQDGAGRQGAVWNNGVQQLIFDGLGGVAQEALAVSDNGAFASGIGIGSFFAPGNAYRYDVSNDEYLAIDNLEVGAERFMAGAAISGDGSIVGGGTWGFGPATFGNGFIWSEALGTLTVSDYFDAVGAEYEEDFHFSFVSDISADGQWFTGWGYNETDGLGSTETWVVRVPAPSGLAILTLGTMTATRRRRC
ncbi:MAG: hypothetical protein ACSHX5_00065 [Phycisphaerales bacterium]